MAALVLSLGKTMAQISAQFAPVPGLSPLVDSLCQIIQLCENVSNNRYAARQLRDRCHTLVLSVHEYEAKAVSDNMVQARNSVHDCLVDIQRKMNGWAVLGKLQSFRQQDDIAKDIALCHNQITDCLNTFNLTSQIEIHAWMAEFEANNKQDHAQLIESLSQIQESQATMVEVMSSTNDLVQQMMVIIQKAMGENKQNAEKTHQGLSANLYQFQSQFKELLPNFHLQSGEVKKVGDVAVRGTASMDIYEGLYLGRERVDIKAIRTMKFDEQSKRRFMREAKIWEQVWKCDHGRHIVPFYGFCQLDGPFPCMVSPWQKNGDALSYVQANDKTLDYAQFIRHIASGVEVLHSMDLVHGDIRAMNILVNDQGNPLLSDFRLSKIILDVTGAPLTQTSMMTDSCRHFAPEAFVDDGVISRASDIYALGMTILEIVTHHQPYRNVKHHLLAAVNAQKGIQPERPTEVDVVRRGLNDKLWDILVLSWSLDPSLRPPIQTFTSL